ncbi:MAG: hypothetical protein L0J60_07910 [Psychroflexus sp.]|nr:hypothetical protein [Psychroflexus sp.]
MKSQKSEKEVDRVAILYNKKDYTKQQLTTCFRQSFPDFKNLKLDLITFVPQKQEDADEEIYVFSKKDFNFFSKLKTEELKSLKGRTYQLIFNLFHEESVYLQLMNSYLKAGFQIGVSDLEQNQMILRTPSNQPKAFFDEAAKYLKHITYESHTI